MKKSLLFSSFTFLLVLVICVTAYSQEWTPIPFIKQELRDQGIDRGGEEGQWPQTIAFEPIHGSYILYGTDVGGMFRSTDEGRTWQPSNIGYAPRGIAFFAIDPNNVNRVIAVGGMSNGNSNNGASLSKDGGITWESTHRMFYKDYKKYNDEVAYDKTSFDAGKGYSMVAYWSCDSSAEPTGAVLFKSTDGGQSWFVKNQDHIYGARSVKVSPNTGSVFLYGDGNLYRSKDGGETFQQILTDNVMSLETIYTHPGTLYLMKRDGIYQSTDDGDTFVRTGSAAIEGNPQRLRVSPANPDNMIHWRDIKKYNWPRYYTTDGGNTWHKSELPRDNKYFFNWNMPRQGSFSYHPEKEDVIISVGNDNVTKSTDAGATFHWSNSGVNNFCPSGMHPLNPFNHNLLLIVGRDKAGAYSDNGGYTWINAKPIELSYNGGHGFCGYAMTEDTLVAVGLDGDHDDKWKICVSTNGGESFVNTGIEFSGERTVCPDITDPAKVYLGAFRSYNYGKTWEKMDGVTGVFTYNPTGKYELYGCANTVVVRSFDHGMTWEPLVNVNEAIDDIAVDHEQDKLYIAANGGLFTCDTSGENLSDIASGTPSDQFGNRNIKSVAVDPNHPGVVYIANSNAYLMDNNIVRSRDHGQSWEILTRNTRFPNPQYGKDGGRMPVYVRVDPSTSEAYVGGGCFGLWKIGPPPEAGPVVKISSPLTRSTLIAGNSTTIVADIFNNNDRVSKVELFINDEKATEILPDSYKYTWEPSVEGDYELYAIATDTSGHAIHSFPVNVHVIPSALPVVSIITPLDNSTFDFNSDIAITAAAEDPDGIITKVTFYSDTVMLGEVTESPYIFNWENVGEGTFTITAAATDNTGQTVRSEPVSITVNEQQYSIFYSEDFNDGEAQDWYPATGTWTVTDGRYRNSTTGDADISLYNGCIFSDYAFSVKVSSDLNNYFGMAFNYQDENNYYFLGVSMIPATVFLRRMLNGSMTTVTQQFYNVEISGEWMNLKLINSEGKTTFLIDGSLVLNKVSTPVPDSGRIGLYTYRDSVWFDDVEVAAKASSVISHALFPETSCKNLTVYPNPVRGSSFTASTGEVAGKADIYIYNMLGKFIYTTQTSDRRVELPAGILNDAGLYLLKWRNGIGERTVKFIYQKK